VSCQCVVVHVKELSCALNSRLDSGAWLDRRETGAGLAG
jgi:hypothetical protein